MRTVLSAAAFALGISASPAAATVLTFEAFGHRIEFEQDRERDPNGDQVLKVDGGAEVRAGMITFERISRLGEMTYFVGLAGTGGNACDLAPFIISLPKSGAPKLYGPVDTCTAVGIEYLDDRIVLREGGFPGDVADVWTWTPAGGIVRTSETLAADGGKGWADLWDKKADHPSALLFNADAAALLERTAGPDWPAIKAQMNGVGEATWVGDTFVSSSCVKSDCSDAGQLTVIDLQTRKAYLAIKPTGGKIRVFPPVKEWPDVPKQGLREWAKAY